MREMTISEFTTRFMHRLWSTNTILLLVRPIGKPLDDSFHKPCPGEFCPITAKNIEDCASFENAEHYVPIYREMLSNGDYGHYGYLDGECVFREWVQVSGTFCFEGCPVRLLSENQGYIHYAYCTPEARGNGFMTRGVFLLTQAYLDRQLFALVREDNLPSLKSLRRNGFEIYSKLTVKNRFFRRKLTEILIINDYSEQTPKRDYHEKSS